MPNIRYTSILLAAALMVFAVPSRANQYTRPFVFHADNTVATATWVQRESDCVEVQATAYAVESDLKRDGSGPDGAIFRFEILKKNACTGYAESVYYIDMYDFKLTSRDGTSAELTGRLPTEYCTWNADRTVRTCVDALFEVALMWDAAGPIVRDREVTTSRGPLSTFMTRFKGTYVPATVTGFVRINGLELIAGSSSSGEIVKSTNSIVSINPN